MEEYWLVTFQEKAEDGKLSIQTGVTDSHPVEWLKWMMEQSPGSAFSILFALQITQQQFKDFDHVPYVPPTVRLQ